MTTSQIIKNTPNITRDGKARRYAECAICRQSDMAEFMRRCPECRQWTCGECWDHESGQCGRCAQ